MLFGLALPLLLLALVEGALALFGIGDELRYEDPFVGFAGGREVFARRTLPDGREVWATNPDRLAFFNPQRFPVDKAPGTYRVFALGGSTTAGRPYDHRVAFPRWLELYLSELDPSRKWEVINAGAISYASYRIAVLMRELVLYQPDLFVLYTGHNELLEERTYEGVLRASPGMRRLRVWLSGRRFYALARHAWLDLTRDRENEPPGLAAEVETKLDGWTGLGRYHRDEELERQVVDHFGWNLERIVALARDAGAGVVLVQPVSNLKDFSPFKSEHGERLSPEDRRRVEALLAKAPASDPATALALLQEAEALDPLYAELHFREGRALLAQERFAEAEAAFVRAKDLDVAPLRALEPVVALIGEIARERDLPLVELPKLLAEENRRRIGHPILGDELLLDHVHPDIPVHRRIAEEIAGAMVREVLPAQGIPAPPWPPTETVRARWQAIYERETAALDREYYARRDLNLSKVLGWAGKYEEAEPPLRRAAEVLTGDPEVHFNLGVLLQRTGRLEEAERELRRALELAPELPEAWFNLGVVLGKRGRGGEAVTAVERALELRPEYPEARYNLGVLRAEAGDTEAAVRALETAVAERVDDPEAHARLGVAYRDQGRFEKAERELRRSLELDSSRASAWTELGLTLARRDRLEAAKEAFEEALRRDPGYAEAHYNLGVLAARRGDAEAALAAYRAAAEADPGHALALNNLGILLIQRGRLDEGAQALEAAVAAQPAYAEAWLNLGIARDNLGMRQEALKAVERAVELQPDEPRFQAALRLLRGAREDGG